MLIRFLARATRSNATTSIWYSPAWDSWSSACARHASSYVFSPNTLQYDANNDYQLPVVVASPSLLRSLQPPVLETFLPHLFPACHHCPVAKASHRRPLVASLRTSQCLLPVRDSHPFHLRVVNLDSPRARVPVPQQV